MPFKDPIKRKEYEKQYREKNRDKRKEYRQTEACKKSNKISKWKYIGIILKEDETWDSIYRKYIECENCEQCNKVFKNSKNKHLDHCHTTGYIRNIVCCRCNVIRGFEDAKLFNE